MTTLCIDETCLCTSSPTRIRVGIECSMEMFKWNHKDHLSIKPKCISKFECHTEEFTIHNTNACNKCTVFKVNGRLMLMLQKWTYQFYTDVNEVTVCLCVCLFTVSKSYAFKSKRMNHLIHFSFRIPSIHMRCTTHRTKPISGIFRWLSHLPCSFIFCIVFWAFSVAENAKFTVNVFV